jgi:hypothetical protein
MTPVNRMKVAPFLLFLAAALAGCAFPHEIEILHSPPTVPYDSIETITYHQAYMGELHDEILDVLRRQGAKLGADAVILTDRHVTREFDHINGFQDSPIEFVTGIAIRYKKSGQPAPAPATGPH